LMLSKWYFLPFLSPTASGIGSTWTLDLRWWGECFTTVLKPLNNQKRLIKIELFCKCPQNPLSK